MIRGKYPQWAAEAGLKNVIDTMKDEFPEMATIARQACTMTGNDNTAHLVREYAEAVAAKAAAKAEAFLSVWNAEQTQELRSEARTPVPRVSKNAVKALAQAGQPADSIATLLKADFGEVVAILDEYGL